MRVPKAILLFANIAKQIASAWSPPDWIWISAANGVELVPVMRRDAHLPIVYLSTFADIEHRLASRQAGGDDYRVKPVDARLLVTAVLARARPFR